MSSNYKNDHWPFLGVILAVILVASFYAWNFNNVPLSKYSGDWGTFGDFVGGITNPIIALSVLWYVWKSFQTNQKAVEELKKQTEIQKLETKILIRQHKLNHVEPIKNKLKDQLDAIDADIEKLKKTNDKGVLYADQISNELDLQNIYRKREHIAKEHVEILSIYSQFLTEIIEYDKDVDKITKEK